MIENICNSANAMVHKILLPSSDEKTSHGEKCSCWGSDSTMSPVSVNTCSHAGNPTPQQPTGLIWINYLNYCSNFLLQTSAFPGRKQHCVYYSIPRHTTIKYHQIGLNNKHFNSRNSSMIQFPMIISHLKVITLNPRLNFFPLFFSIKCLFFSENGLNISVSHLREHFPISNSWKMGLYIICRKISLPLKYTFSENNDEQPTSILHYRGTSPAPFSNVPLTTSD